VPNRRRPAVLMAELPDVLALWRPEIEARQASKVGGKHKSLGDERGAGDKALGAPVPLAHHQIARRQRRKAHADGDIESFRVRPETS
jgi:hypothetical protein